MNCFRILCLIPMFPAWIAPAPAQGQEERLNMELVGSHDLQGRSAYQPPVHARGGRWIANTGMHILELTGAARSIAALK